MVFPSSCLKSIHHRKHERILNVIVLIKFPIVTIHTSVVFFYHLGTGPVNILLIQFSCNLNSRKLGIPRVYDWSISTGQFEESNSNYTARPQFSSFQSSKLMQHWFNLKSGTFCSWQFCTLRTVLVKDKHRMLHLKWQKKVTLAKKNLEAAS